MSILDWLTGPSAGGNFHIGGAGSNPNNFGGNGILGGNDFGGIMDPRQARLMALQQGLAGAAAGILSGRGLGQAIPKGLIGASYGVADARRQAMDEGLFGLKVKDYLARQKADQTTAGHEAKRQEAFDYLAQNEPAAYAKLGPTRMPWEQALQLYGENWSAKWTTPQDLEPPPTRNRDYDGETIQEEFDKVTGTWKEYGRRPQFEPRQPPAPAGNDGTFQGTSMDAQSWNIILTGDPGTAEYHAAYNMLFEQPKMVQTENGIMPVMPAIPQTVRPPSGTGVMPSDQSTVGQPTAGPPIPGTQPGLTPGQRTEYSKKTAQLDNLSVSLNTYRALLDEQGASMLGAIGVPTSGNRQLKSAYTNLLIEMKNLFELGALSGPDYDLMTSSVTDPNSMTGVSLGVEGLKPQLDQIDAKLQAARNIVESQYGKTKQTGKTGGDTLWVIVDGKLVRK